MTVIRKQEPSFVGWQSLSFYVTAPVIFAFGWMARLYAWPRSHLLDLGSMYLMAWKSFKPWRPNFKSEEAFGSGIQGQVWIPVWFASWTAIVCMYLHPGGGAPDFKGWSFKWSFSSGWRYTWDFYLKQTWSGFNCKGWEFGIQLC